MGVRKKKPISSDELDQFAARLESLAKQIRELTSLMKSNEISSVLGEIETAKTASLSRISKSIGSLWGDFQEQKHNKEFNQT